MQVKFANAEPIQKHQPKVPNSGPTVGVKFSDDEPISSNKAIPTSPATERLLHVIDHAAHLLPAQGPIQVFIHHNTLHAFEEKTFDEAVQEGGAIFGAQPYLTEERYRAALVKGRIHVRHLRSILADELGSSAQESIAGLTNRSDLRLAMLEHPLWTGNEAGLRWHMAEQESLKKFASFVPESVKNLTIADTRRWMMRESRTNRMPEWLNKLFERFPLESMERWDHATWEALTLEIMWASFQLGWKFVPTEKPTLPNYVRHRDWLLEATAIDADLPVNDLLIRFTAAFVDQGVSHWPLPDRSAGFYESFLQAYHRPMGAPERWRASLALEATRLLNSKVSPLDCILESLELLGVHEEEWDEYLSACVMPLRGWGGMIRQMEERADRVARPIPPGSFAEFLAIRLLLDRLSADRVARDELRHEGSLATLRESLRRDTPTVTTVHPDVSVFPAFQLGQLLGWTPRSLSCLPPERWREIYQEISSFHGVERRRVFQRAYEAQFREQTLDAIGLHERTPLTSRPSFQVITCLDEREESFRRHIEEVAPSSETFGAAGFFGVAMYYRGAADPIFTPLCPIVLTPKHWVEEHVCESHQSEHQRKTKTRKAIGEASHRIHNGTRTFAAGAFLTAVFGVLASFPLIFRILFPALAGRISRGMSRAVRPPTATELHLERSAEQSGPKPEEIGYSVTEMAATAERFLLDIGMTKQFGRLVFILGHGSFSQNNPHKSAYDCGACGGSPGAPNGRALAQMLNDPRVRSIIAGHGIHIPEDTHFVGGFHNTCDDSVQLADTGRLPASHQLDLLEAQRVFDEVGNRNAHERCRRFMSASLSQSTVDARWHVQNRSEDLAQTRPELGHATNAICVVGRREVTRGLFLDRRAFLASYDPLQDDPKGSTLLRLLSAAVPVCGGINLEYYFSHVDSPGYGCGTKLPHNITSLLGVMDGAASDLRTGLPWQMVEIHEPVRLLFVVESTPEIMFGIMNGNELIGRMIRNGWVQMTLLDPKTRAISVYQDGEFRPTSNYADHLPKAKSSLDWYRGWREHLEFAAIDGKGA